MKNHYLTLIIACLFLLLACSQNNKEDGDNNALQQEIIDLEQRTEELGKTLEDLENETQKADSIMQILKIQELRK